jgi:hypothetical protein
VKANIVSAVCFAAFVGAGLLVAAGRQFPAGWDKRLINAFLLIALFASFTSGLSTRDMWPFSSWNMMTGVTPPAGRALPTLSIVGVDADGKEYDIDYRTWEPLSPEELHSWLRHSFYQLDPAARDRVASYLLQRSNLAREQALSTAGLAYSNRWLGRLTAPTHLLHPPLWSHPESVPPNPFVRLRIYGESWDLERGRLAPGSMTRVLAYEYPRL